MKGPGPIEDAVAALAEVALHTLRPALGRILGEYLETDPRAVASGLPCTIENREREQIRTTLLDLGGSLALAARLLGVSRQNLEHRIRRLAVQRPPRAATARARGGRANPTAKVARR